ncbi:MAG: MFS transporter [Thermodesulfobacteriota bacterium]|nr:MAG: MFS transporter [Thermodesulfobacteriota bacterium]
MESQQNPSSSADNKKIAFQFIIFMGAVSLFGDITYEGARSITGPYLAVLGASASIVGLVAGFGEFIGYGLRLVSGYFSDRTQQYWTVTIIGYGLLCSIPLLAFAGYWQIAAFLIIAERMGKGIRTPARDTILSHATKQVGRGLGFGIHEALDQIGAIIGPLIFSAVFIFEGGYRKGFTILWIPALLCVATLLVARIKLPSPEKLETSGGPTRQNIQGKGRLPRIFWFYALFSFFSVAGFVNFQIISYHFKVQSVISDVQIPVFYAIAMGADALVALIIGKTYDKIGLISLVSIPLLTLPIPLFAFSHSYGFAIIGVLLWGTAMGIHETIMRAAIADLTPIEHRGFAYGIFNTVYGVAWFLGSALIGLLYDFSILYLILFVVVMEAISVIAFFLLKKEIILSQRSQEIRTALLK